MEMLARFLISLYIGFLGLLFLWGSAIFVILLKEMCNYFVVMQDLAKAEIRLVVEQAEKLSERK